MFSLPPPRHISTLPPVLWRYTRPHWRARKFPSTSLTDRLATASNSSTAVLSAAETIACNITSGGWTYRDRWRGLGVAWRLHLDPSHRAVSKYQERRDLAAMFSLTFLGTSASVPSVERNHPGFLVEAGTNRILVDAHDDFWSFATYSHRNTAVAL